MAKKRIIKSVTCRGSDDEHQTAAPIPSSAPTYFGLAGSVLTLLKRIFDGFPAGAEFYYAGFDPVSTIIGDYQVSTHHDEPPSREGFRDE